MFPGVSLEFDGVTLPQIVMYDTGVKFRSLRSDATPTSSPGSVLHQSQQSDANFVVIIQGAGFSAPLQKQLFNY
jgi:hypothetical protein